MEMRKLLSLSLFLLLFSCNAESDNALQGKKNDLKTRSDTTVGIENMPADVTGSGYIEKEYFVVIRTDTLNTSCIFTENKSTGKMSMKYRYDPYGNIPYKFYLDDTAAVAKEEPVKKSIKKLSYKNQIRELELILNAASKDFNVSKLSTLRFSISSIDELSPDITRQYLHKYGEKFLPGYNQNAADLINSSRFKADVSKILAPYSLDINKISIDGLTYYVPQRSAKGTKPLLDGVIIISLVGHLDKTPPLAPSIW
jgi:hypothetical protein